MQNGAAVHYTFKQAPGLLRAELFGRQSAEETHEFVEALLAEAHKLALTRVLAWVRNSRPIFKVETGGGFKEFGLTELFFEGAEPSLDEVPLEELLALFPEGEYEFSGKTVEEGKIAGTATLTHAIPAGPPNVSAVLGPGRSLIISWNAVTGPPAGFPNRPIVIVGYQVIVSSFQVTLPASARSVTVPPEFVESLESGEHEFEVLAIEASGNQSITADSFTKP